MKNTLYPIFAAILIQPCFYQFASSNALNVTCTNDDPSSNNKKTAQVIVKDNWLAASVFFSDDPWSISLKCNGPKVRYKDFQCEYRSYDDPDMDIFYVLTFIWDAKEKMTLNLTADMDDDNLMISYPGTQSYHCT